MSHTQKFRRNVLAAGIASFLSVGILNAATVEESVLSLNINKQKITKSLIDLTKSSGVQIVLSENISGSMQVPAIKGEYSLSNALNLILSNTGLTYEFISDDTVLIKEGNADSKENSDKTKENVEEIVVTGSRITRASSQVAANVIVMDAEALRATGENTLERALRQLPQNIYGATEVGAVMSGTGMSFNGALNITGGSSINLRGLGSESTLVLIDGRRIGKSGLFGGISDISAIPLASVERVEIMLDGASAIYGSDAVGGVVNIILKKDYDDTEITYEYGAPEAGGFSEHMLTLSGGTHWDSGRVRATFERFQRNNLDGAERPERIYRTVYQSPARVIGFPVFYQYNGQNYLPSELATEGLTPDMEGVQAVGYAQLPGDWDGIGELSIADLTGFASHDDSYDPDAGDGISLIPSQERHTLQVGFDQSLPWFGGDIILSGSAYYSDRQTQAANGSFTFSPRFHVLDPGNPLPFEGSMTNSLYWRISGLADKHYETDQQVTRWNLALDGEVGESWRWQVSAGQSRDRIDSLYVGNAIPATYWSEPMLDYYRGFGYTEERLAAFDYRFTELVDAGLNVFAGDIKKANDPVLLAQLVESPQTVFAINRENTFEASANGVLFALPGGDVHLAVGANWREESLKSRSERSVSQLGFVTNWSTPTSAFDAEANRIVRSVFTEVLLPLVGSGNSMPGVEQLSLTGAARYDSYNWYRGDSTWSLGLIWSPIDQLRIKANQSTSYVVPTPREALIEPVIYNYNGAFGPSFYDESGNYVGSGQGFDLYGKYIYGGNPDLQPETASTVSAGVEFTPESIPGLTLSATWHQTTYHNRIGSSPSPEFILGTDYVSKYHSLTRDEETGWLNLDTRAINFASVEVAGVDYRLRYNRETAIGQFILTTNISYTGQYDRLEVAGEGPVNEVADVSFQSQSVIPAYRYSANLGWYHRGLSANLDASTASKTVSTADVFSTVIQRVGKAALAMDLLFAYDFEQGDLFSSPAWLGKTAVSLKILNVLDDHPKYEINNLTTGEPHNVPELNANLADPRGRMFYLSLTRRFN